MRLLPASWQVSVRFDEPNLVSCAGLGPVLRLATRCGLPAVVSASLTLAGSAGAFAADKVLTLVAGMVAVPTPSRTWMCCATAGCAGWSPGSARPRRWARCCGRSPSATSGNSTASPPAC